MRINRLRIGLIKWHVKPSWVEKWLYIGCDKTLCGCYEIAMGRFYICWLSDECLKAERKDNKKKIKLPKSGGSKRATKKLKKMRKR